MGRRKAGYGIRYIERASEQSIEFLLVSAQRDYLIRSDGSQVKVKSLEGKSVLLYFSAHYFPIFPPLVDIYNQRESHGADFEVVFISPDQDASHFEAQFKEMPWLAIPFEDYETRENLERWFEVRPFPTIIVLDAKGKTLTTQGWDLLEKHGLEACPFTAERLAEILAQEKARREAQTLESLLCNGVRDFLISSDGQEVKISSIKGKTVGLYFSADWCPPCHKFTPKLISTYNELRKRGEDFEIVFITGDNEEEAFKSYFGSMPWLAIPFSDRKFMDSVAEYFNIDNIPALVILDSNAKTLTFQAQPVVRDYGSAAFPFTETHIFELRKAKDKIASKLPYQIQHSSHPQHPLVLAFDVYGVKPYYCNKCDDRGWDWVYHCDQCSYDLHPSCSDTLLPEPDEPSEPSESSEHCEGPEVSDSEVNATSAPEVKQLEANVPSEGQAAAAQHIIVSSVSEEEKGIGFVCEGDACKRV